MEAHRKQSYLQHLKSKLEAFDSFPNMPKLLNDLHIY